MSIPVAVLTCIVLALLASVSAFFSGMETALFSINGFQVRRWREREPAVAEQFERLMVKSGTVLSVILLTDTLVNIPLIILTLVFVDAIPAPVPNWLKTLVIFGLIVFVCDLLPKVLALADPFRFSKGALRILTVLMPIAEPFSRFLQELAEKTADLFAKERPFPQDHLNDEELETLVELGVEEGELSAGEREMIQEIIKLGDKTVKDCMTPRVDAFTIPDTLTNEEVIAQVRLKRHGRVPVYGESPDEILGILDVKSFLLDHDEHYTERLEAPSFVPATMRALDLLRGFLTHAQRLAIVVDEFGGTEGVVTFNDIVEEVIGDAVPRGDEALYIEEISKDKWLASGSARLDDLGELVGVDLKQEGLDTIGGLIFNQLGYLPKPGTCIKIPPLLLEIRQSSRKRVLEVAVEKMRGLAWERDA
ncbi:MAG: HlyC/CorC family transporter [Verrucomicrobia bacterium]|nr:HlyC/CorC family transporter [Verrucomicrobiota bacterium]MBV9297430.1 HlyC/CorC family transporter [Verrucomicrobiota bacterium]